MVILAAAAAAGRGLKRPLTYGVDPDAEVGGVEGHRQGVRVGVDAHRVLVDGSGQQGRRRVVVVQHGRQQRGRLRLRAAHGHRHALSCGDTFDDSHQRLGFRRVSAARPRASGDRDVGGDEWETRRRCLNRAVQTGEPFRKRL